MAANPITASMSIVLPVPGQTEAFGIAPAGESWMELQNTGFNTVDQHDHTTGKGLPIRPAGIMIDDDLDFESNNAIGLRAVRFEGIDLGDLGVSDIDELVVSDGDLYYVDGDGTQIQITADGALAGTPGSISGLVPPASASYASGPKLFTFSSSSGFVAGIAAGPLVLTDASTSGGNAATIKVPAALAANYQITLPSALPVSTKFLNLSSAGVVGFYDVDNSTLEISSSTVQVKDLGITRPKLAAVGQQISSSSGSFHTSSTTFVDVTNLTVTITTTGRPVRVELQTVPGSTTDSGYITFFSGSTTMAVSVKVLRGATSVGQYFMRFPAGGDSAYSVGWISYLDTPAAGTYTYKAQMKVDANDATMTSAVLVAYEL